MCCHVFATDLWEFVKKRDLNWRKNGGQRNFLDGNIDPDKLNEFIWDATASFEVFGEIKKENP